MTIGSLAALILGAVVVQLGLVLTVWLYRQTSTHRGARTLGPEATPKITESQVPAAASAWQGWREFLVDRRVVEDESRSVCSYYLVPTDGRPLPSYRPGQYLTFQLTIKHPLTGEAMTLVRCYSLSDRPRPDSYRVSIKRVPPPADRPDLPAGLSSNFFHEQVQKGTRLSVKAPAGHFHLAEAPLPIVLVAGGIGITPMLSMLSSVLDSGVPREVWLFYGVRNGAEQIMKGHLQELARLHPRFHLHVCYGDPEEGAVAGVDYQHRGWIDVDLLRATLKLARYQFYVCGPRPMMESLVPALEEWGVAHGDIYYESFGPASLSRTQPPAAAPAGPFTVTFSRTGKQAAWNARAGSLLDFAEDQGVKVDSGCRAGSCGSCQTGLTTGEVAYVQQPDADIQPGSCLPCISVPKSDLTLEA